VRGEGDIDLIYGRGRWNVGKHLRRLKRYSEMARMAVIRDPYKRAEYCRKKKYFYKQGIGCYFQIFNFNTEPHLISMGDNVHIATGVSFFTHDVIAHMLRRQFEGEEFETYVGGVKIGSNVFIGGNSTILYDVSIGDNVIIGANSLVTKDIPSNAVAVGQPARVVGDYDDYVEKMRNYTNCVKALHSSRGKASVKERQMRQVWGG
jgi:acetyltransferase-like isoleucine patch superfamily enzyme